MKKPKPKSKLPAHLAASTRAWAAQIEADYALESHHLRYLVLAGEAWDRGCAARAVIDEKGMTYTDKNGDPRARPEVAIERDCRIAFARLMRELNLDSSPPPDTRLPRRTGEH